MRRSKAFSMVEAVISIAILFSATLVLIALYHSGLRYTTRIQNQQLACLMAERTLEGMRAWGAASTGPVYNFDNWTPYQGTTTVPADYPNYLVTTSVTNVTLYSSCSQMEQGNPVGQQRAMVGTAVQARVNVSWDSGTHSLSVSSLIANPPRPAATVPVQVVATTAVPDPIPRGATVSFSATAVDGNGQTIPGVLFSWDLAAGNGNGTLVQSRDGSACNFTNVVELPNPLGTPAFLPTYSGGSAVVEARARIHGLSVVGATPPMPLSP